MKSFCHHLFLLVLLSSTTYVPAAQLNGAGIAGSPVKSGPGESASIAEISAASSPNISITNTVDHPVIGPGGALHYTIIVTNHGPAAPAAVLTDQSVRESLESCVVSNGDPCAIVFHQFNAVVNLSSLASGETRTISVSALASKTAGDYNPIANVAQISSGPPLNAISSASAPVTVRDTADIVTTSSLISATNGLLHYVDTVTNLGPDTAHAILFLHSIPANTEFITASSTEGRCNFYPNIGADGAVRCPLSNPNVNASVQIDIIVQALSTSCPTATSTAYVTSQSIDPNSNNNSSTVTANLPLALCATQPPPNYQVSTFYSNDVRWGARYLNNNGDLLGFVLANNGESFLYKNGATKPVIFQLQNAAGFNDLDEVVGSNYDYANGLVQAKLYKDGALQPLDFGPQFPQGNPTGINNLHQIIGNAIGPNNRTSSAFLYQGGVATSIGQLPNAVYTNVAGINNKGEMTGSSGNSSGINAKAFLYTHALTLNVAPLSSVNSYGGGINSSGTLEGYFTRQDPQINYDTFTYGNGLFSYPSYGAGASINDCGDLAGGSAQGAFLYKNGTYFNLDKLFAFPAEQPHLFYPIAINNRGQILGMISAYATQDSAVVLLTPPVLEKCGSDAAIENTPDAATIAAGGVITYTIKTANLATATTQFTVIDDLDARTTLVSCTVAGGEGTCTPAPGGKTLSIALPNLTKGSTATITIRAKTADTYAAKTVLMNTATVSSSLTSNYLSTAYTSVP